LDYFFKNYRYSQKKITGLKFFNHLLLQSCKTNKLYNIPFLRNYFTPCEGNLMRMVLEQLRVREMLHHLQMICFDTNLINKLFVVLCLEWNPKTQFPIRQCRGISVYMVVFVFLDLKMEHVWWGKFTNGRWSGSLSNVYVLGFHGSLCDKAMCRYEWVWKLCKDGVSIFLLGLSHSYLFFHPNSWRYYFFK